MASLIEILNRTEQTLKKECAALKNLKEKDFYTAQVQGVKDLHTIPDYLKIGNIVKDGFAYPALFQMRQMVGAAFELNETNTEEATFSLESIVLQIMNRMDPKYFRITLFDPRKLGNSFKNIRRIGKVIVDSADMKREVDQLFNDSIRIMNENLATHKDIDDYNAATGEIQPYRFVFISEFPYGLRDCIDKINTLMNTAKESGLFFFFTYDPSIDLGLSSSKMLVNEILSQVAVFREINQPEDIYQVKNVPREAFYNKQHYLKLDRYDIDESILQNEVSNVQNRTQKKLSFNISEGIRIPIGKSAGASFFLTIGHESDNYHGIIGGQPGKGKTTLLNNIIVNGMSKYKPRELQFVLVDCAGVAFQEFKDSSYVLNFCCSSNVETCLDSVKYMENLLQEREQLFKENKVTELRDYLSKTGKPLPRVLCIIDEFHVLFTGNARSSAYVESILVERVIRIGRKFGIHLIVSTQSLGGGVRRSFLDNIPLRMALGMTADQSAGFLGFNNEAAANIERGYVIYNNDNGAPRANKLVKVPYLSLDEIEKKVQLYNKK